MEDKNKKKKTNNDKPNNSITNNNKPNKTKINNDKPKTKKNKKKKKTNLAVRIMAITMAILMLLSSLSMIFAYF